jgi:transcriptional regulator with XRE-family HTH domain
MKERIRQIQDREGMSQKDFAAAIGISQASLSSIYNGRTLPTNRHVEAIHKRFPEISTNWIMFGEGEMLLSDADAALNSNLTEGNSQEDESVRQEETLGSSLDKSSRKSDNRDYQGDLFSTAPVVREIVKYIDKPQRRIREIQVIYDDGILETFVLKSDK